MGFNRRKMDDERRPYLWVRCPGCCCMQSVDLRRLDRHLDMMVTGLIPALSCRACGRMRRSRN
jgi:hypothetical protein